MASSSLLEAIQTLKDVETRFASFSCITLVSSDEVGEARAGCKRITAKLLDKWIINNKQQSLLNKNICLAFSRSALAFFERNSFQSESRFRNEGDFHQERLIRTCSPTPFQVCLANSEGCKSKLQYETLN